MPSTSKHRNFQSSPVVHGFQGAGKGTYSQLWIQDSEGGTSLRLLSLPSFLSVSPSYSCLNHLSDRFVPILIKDPAVKSICDAGDSGCADRGSWRPSDQPAQSTWGLCRRPRPFQACNYWMKDIIREYWRLLKRLVKSHISWLINYVLHLESIRQWAAAVRICHAICREHHSE
jgi:hypothetical protein